MRRLDAAALFHARSTNGLAENWAEYGPALFGTALVLHNDPDGARERDLWWDTWEARRRAAATDRVCHLACMAYEEGARLASERMLDGIRALDRVQRREIVDGNAPTYTELRNFLIGELDADWRVACRVAMERITRWARLYGRETYRAGAERGWL